MFDIVSIWLDGAHLAREMRRPEHASDGFRSTLHYSGALLRLESVYIKDQVRSLDILGLCSDSISMQIGKS